LAKRPGRTVISAVSGGDVFLGIRVLLCGDIVVSVECQPRFDRAIGSGVRRSQGPIGLGGRFGATARQYEECPYDSQSQTHALRYYKRSPNIGASDLMDAVRPDPAHGASWYWK
jgi:hypothetical protein